MMWHVMPWGQPWSTVALRNPTPASPAVPVQFTVICHGAEVISGYCATDLKSLLCRTVDYGCSVTLVWSMDRDPTYESLMLKTVERILMLSKYLYGVLGNLYHAQDGCVAVASCKGSLLTPLSVIIYRRGPEPRCKLHLNLAPVVPNRLGQKDCEAIHDPPDVFFRVGIQ